MVGNPTSQPNTSKFNKRTVDTIIEAIGLSGIEARGYQAAGVSKAAYFKWKRTNEKFAARIEEALEEYRVNRREQVLSQIRAAEELSLDYLVSCLNGDRQKVITVTETYGENTASPRTRVTRTVMTESPPSGMLTEMMKRLLSQAGTEPQEININLGFQPVEGIASEAIEQAVYPDFADDEVEPDGD
jgi:tRNA U34 5-carboxymethylaminomethyl modifying enzyme MnmG/GidA